MELAYRNYYERGGSKQVFWFYDPKAPCLPVSRADHKMPGTPRVVLARCPSPTPCVSPCLRGPRPGRCGSIPSSFSVLGGSALGGESAALECRRSWPLRHLYTFLKMWLGAQGPNLSQLLPPNTSATPTKHLLTVRPVVPSAASCTGVDIRTAL